MSYSSKQVSNIKEWYSNIENDFTYLSVMMYHKTKIMFPGLQMVVTKTRICKMAQDLLFSVKDRFIVFAGLIVMLYWLSQNYISKLQNMYTCLCK